jgi:hypothetical protein
MGERDRVATAEVQAAHVPKGVKVSFALSYDEMPQHGSAKPGFLIELS